MKRYILFVLGLLFSSNISAEINVRNFQNPLIEGFITGYSASGIQRAMNKKKEKQDAIDTALFFVNCVNVVLSLMKLNENSNKKVPQIIAALVSAYCGTKVEKEYIFAKLERYLFPFGVFIYKVQSLT